jgi:hypothetical protein
MMLLVVPCQVLGRVDTLRKRITSVGKQHASVCAKVNVYQLICIDLQFQLMGMHTGLLYLEIKMYNNVFNKEKISNLTPTFKSQDMSSETLLCAHT